MSYQVLLWQTYIYTAIAAGFVTLFLGVSRVQVAKPTVVFAAKIYGSRDLGKEEVKWDSYHQ